MSNSPKILLFDIETTPNLGWAWKKYDQNIIKYEKGWYILCFAAKWLGEKKIHTAAIPDFPSYEDMEPNALDDKEVCLALWEMLDEADIVVGHNSNRFDIRKANKRFLVHGLMPPSPYLKVDTLSMSRQTFQFDSNKLNDLAEELGLGKKEQTGGIGLWFDCMLKDAAAWKKMVKYCSQDIRLLERVYLKMRPWIKTHPNLNNFMRGKQVCPTCGSAKLHRRGFSYTGTQKYQRWACTACGKFSQSVAAEKYDKEDKVQLK